MRLLLLSIFSIFLFISEAQINQKMNINLYSKIHPNPGTGNRYSGCWGWKQTSTNKEYAILGGSNGTYFVDVSVPASPSVCAYVPGKNNCTWREIKTYQNYCYVVSDDASPNRFQIIDMSTLPGTVTVVHDGTTYFERGHTIWIDNNKMYIGSTTYSTGTNSPMNVYSLATPTAPVLLRSLPQDYSFITYVHDMFVSNDTIFASCGYQGLYLFKLTATNTFTQLGAYTGYASSYNHSGMWTADRKNFLFCDEVPAAQPIRIVNIQNFSNIQPVQTFIPSSGTTPHNPYLIGNNHAVISCYQDGVYIYNISVAGNAVVAGYFDTYHQGGWNTGSYGGNAYAGNWGAYPWLPSGILLALDMQNGLFVLDPVPAYSTQVGINKKAGDELFSVYPNPASQSLKIAIKENTGGTYTLHNMLGQTLLQGEIKNAVHTEIQTSELANGTYLLNVKSENKSSIQKIIIQH